MLIDGSLLVKIGNNKVFMLIDSQNDKVATLKANNVILKRLDLDE